MDEKILEIGYHLLQNEYLEKHGYSINDDIINRPSVFPIAWFSYSFEERIKILQMALKNGIDLDEATEIRRIEMIKRR